MTAGPETPFIGQTHPIGKNDLTGRCVLIWCSGEDVVNDLLLVAGVVALFACTVCVAVAATAAVVSVGLGVYQATQGRPAEAAVSIISGLTFGIGGSVGRLTGAVKRISQVSHLLPPQSGITARTGARFERLVNRPIQAASRVYGIFETIVQAFSRVSQALESVRPKPRSLSRGSRGWMVI